MSRELSKYWRRLPLKYLIIEVLERKGGSAKDIDIYNEISEITPVTPSDFLKALMVLEMQGIVYVEPLGKDMRNVELRKTP